MLTDPWSWLTDAQLTAAARREARAEHARRRRRDRERRARLTVYRGSTKDNDEEGGDR